MAHFAKINSENVVDQVVVVHNNDAPDEASGIAFLNTLFGDANWVQTSYNTAGGQHRLGGTPLRKNYAGVGYIYDQNLDAFYAPKPYASWILDEATCVWQAPVSMPTDDKNYYWDEPTVSWKVVVVTP
jgi:hypothetical protein